jgi:lycopene beta-cyclase
MAPKQYDYIIAGAGCAGLSLLKRMMEDPFFIRKKILIVDRKRKITNDRTWCFWETGQGLFEGIVHHQWQQVYFHTNDFSKKLDLHPYQYKMIQGIDLYNDVIQKASNYPNIEFRVEEVLSISTSESKAELQLKDEIVVAEYLFNSILFEKDKVAPSKYVYQLLQHFKGWVIETSEPRFDPTVATLMDFRVSQEYGTTFFYVMPTSPTTALVEYTLFSESLLPKDAYDASLKSYISEYLGIDEYKILHDEFGIIPMTNQRFPLQEQRIVHMGVAGGQVKGSSGYAFQFIQKRTATIIEGLKKEKLKFDIVGFHQKKGNLYDAVLLHVLHHHKMPGTTIFESIFSKNKTEIVLRFLDNESSLLEDLQIMNSVPTNIFLPAALIELSH